MILYIISYILIAFGSGFTCYKFQISSMKNASIKEDIIAKLTPNRLVATAIVKGLLWPITLIVEVLSLILVFVLATVFLLVK